MRAPAAPQGGVAAGKFRRKFRTCRPQNVPSACEPLKIVTSCSRRQFAREVTHAALHSDRRIALGREGCDVNAGKVN